MVFHGHDHLFAKQELDGIVCLTCPQPGDAEYSYGFLPQSGYSFGTILPNSGHVEVSVDSERVRVDYVRSRLPGDGPNGEVACSFYLGLSGDLDHDGRVDLADLAQWFTAGRRGDRAADLDADGDADHDDLMALLANYGRDITGP